MAKPLRRVVPQAPLYQGGLVSPQAVTPVSVSQHNDRVVIATSQVTNLDIELALLAPLASPPLTGTPTAPTAIAGTNTTQLATTAFVAAGISSLDTDIIAEQALLAPLASPALTGTPTAPTAAVGANTTQLATTAFVIANKPVWPMLQPETLSANLTIPTGFRLDTFGDFDINATLDVAGTYEAH